MNSELGGTVEVKDDALRQAGLATGHGETFAGAGDDPGQQWGLGW